MSTTELQPAVTGGEARGGVQNLTLLHTVVLSLLCICAPVVEVFRLTSLSSLANSDVWWHLQTGLWILQHHAIPRTSLFSQSIQLPWIATSWAYVVLIALGYKVLGLRAIPILLMWCKAGLAAMVFVMARGHRENFLSALVLSAIAQYVLFDQQALPIYFSILFFAAELLLLMDVRRSGETRRLLWLPVLFVVWTNVHSGFIYGLLLLGLFAISTFVEQWSQRAGATWFENGAPGLSQGTIAAVTGLSLLATLLNPYGYRAYAATFEDFGGPADKYFPDLHAIGFRRPQDYVLLLLTMAAFLALGRRRSHNVFSFALLIGTALLSFHRQHDCWLVVLGSVAIIAEAVSGDALHNDSPLAQHRYGYKWGRTSAIAAAMVFAVVLVLEWVRLPADPQLLSQNVAKTYPVSAANYVRDHHLPQPLFNNYDWGGFLAWYLPEYPVAIDGRRDLYGGEEFMRYFKAMNAETAPTEEPSLANARTLILPRRSLMGQAFSNLSMFKVAYQDDVAVVLLRTD